jgi:hypothetical protein
VVCVPVIHRLAHGVRALAVAEPLARRMPALLLLCAALVAATWVVLARGPYYPPPPPPVYPAPYPYPPPPPVVVYQPMPVVQPTVCGCVDCGCAPCVGCGCGGPGPCACGGPGCVVELDACACGDCAGDCVAVPPIAIRDRRAGPAVRPTIRGSWESALGGVGLCVPLLVLALWRRRSDPPR